MNREIAKPISAVFDEFVPYLSAADILFAKNLAKISSKIINKRLELGMNQKVFAEYLGVSQGMVSKWESSDYNFTIKALTEVCCKLDLIFDMQICEVATKVENLSIKDKYSTGLVLGKKKETINKKTQDHRQALVCDLPLAG